MLVDWALDLVWMRLPRAGRRVWPGLADAVAESAYLASFRLLTLAAPVAALLLGLVAGAFHLGFRDVFTESVPLVAGAVALGLLGPYPGALLAAGFAVGDLFVAHPDRSFGGQGVVAGLVALGAPLLIQYSLLALLCVVIPLGAKRLSAHVTAASPPGVRRIASPSAFVALAALLVYVWSQSVPFLMRPLFTWAGRLPTSEMSLPLLRGSALITGVVVAACLARLVLERIAGASADRAARIAAIRARLSEPPARSSLGDLGLVPSTAVWALWSTVMLAGIIDYAYEWVVVFLLTGAIAGIRMGALGSPLGRWERVVGRVPLGARLAVAGIGIYLVPLGILRGFAPSPDFTPMILALGVSLLEVVLLVPGLVARQAVRRS